MAVDFDKLADFWPVDDVAESEDVGVMLEL
jgi:hypothetical protein